MWYYGRRIRIEPDWNVKLKLDLSGVAMQSIRIEPDWNVKLKIKISHFLNNLLE